MPANIKAIELNYILVDRMQTSASRVRLLSIITLVVAVLLLASYASQVILPFATGQTTATVNLLDPALLVFEGLLIVLTIAWIYVGAVNLLWSRRISKRIRELENFEDRLANRIG
jgi:hypothetical protein